MRKREKLDLWLEAIEDDKEYEDMEDVEEGEEDEEGNEVEEPEEEPEEGEPVEESIVSENEEDKAPSMTQQHYVYIINFIVDILSGTYTDKNKVRPFFTKPVVLGDPVYNAILNLALNRFGRTNAGFKDEIFTNKFKEVFGKKKNTNDDISAAKESSKQNTEPTDDEGSDEEL